MKKNLLAFTLWLALLGVLLIACAWIIGPRPNLRIYAVGTGAVVWLLAVFGFTELAKVPVRRWLRSLVDRVDTGPWWGWILVGFCVAVIASISTHIGLCIWHRSQYESGIDRARTSSNLEVRLNALTQAFCVAPERIEAQALLETLFWKERTSGGNRTLICRFIADPRVESVIAVRRQIARPHDEHFRFGDPCVNAEESRVMDDPVTWYLALMPEITKSPEDGLFQVCFATIPEHPTLEQKIFEATMRLELAKPGTPEFQNLGTELQKLDQEARDGGHSLKSEGVDPFYLEVLWDRLAEWTLDDKPGTKESAATAITYLAKVMEHRSRLFSDTTPSQPVLRPPEKLLAYAFYQDAANIASRSPYAASLVAAYYKSNPDLKALYLERIYKLNQGTFGLDNTKWLKATFADPTFDSTTIPALLSEGWKY